MKSSTMLETNDKDPMTNDCRRGEREEVVHPCRRPVSVNLWSSVAR